MISNPPAPSTQVNYLVLMGSENDYPWKETDRLREEVQRTSSGTDQIRVRQGRWPVSMARCLPSVSHHRLRRLLVSGLRKRKKCDG
ncbi:hypothetical protein MRB53_001846 [Persea americana]|uniref:Uncharacterized protein n=1 Tax=Persea americana TaxID=3435 RepID=A0ACC2MTT4_PERAE|nr:hypothetical protein MRB53_001846 [Persea americana]